MKTFISNLMTGFIVAVIGLCVSPLHACAESSPVTESNDNNEINMELKVKITVNGHTLTATFADNVTARAFLDKLPCTLPMMDLYGREMCYRFPESLPTDNAYTQGYEVGDIVYYPPMHSFVIMYRQNGERFQMQKLGRIDAGVEIFDGIGDVNVKFEASTTSGISSMEIDSDRITVMGQNVEISIPGDINAGIYDISGRLIAVGKGNDRCVIDCSGYNGVALLKINIGGKSCSKKILIG